MPPLYVTMKRIPNLYSYILALMPSYTEYNFKHRCLVIPKVNFSSILFYKVFHMILIFCVLISPFSYTNHNVSKTFIVMPKKFLIYSEFFIGFYGAVLSLIFFNISLYIIGFYFTMPLFKKLKYFLTHVFKGRGR